MHPLIGTARLAEALQDPKPPVVVDVRWRLGGPPGRQSYEQDHLPGAVFLDVDQDLAGSPGEGGRHPLPDPDDLRKVLREAGVRTGRAVVAYDDGDGSIAARLWWLLRWSGHQDVAVLDGGYAAWVAEGRQVTAEVPTPEAGDIEVHPGAMPVIDADEAADVPERGVLLDARARERYAGETEPVDPRAGHIPGARNAPFSNHIADGHWKAPDQLKQYFEDLGVTPDAPTSVYCGSGVTATSLVLAMQVAGLPTPSLYAGSWSHWAQDADRPVATGME